MCRRRELCLKALLVGLFLTTVSYAQVLKIADLSLSVPADWTITQTAKSSGVTIVGLTKPGLMLSLYEQAQFAINMNSIFVNGSTVVSAAHNEAIGDLTWNVMETSKGVYRVKAFSFSMNGHTYYGYARARSAPEATAAVDQILTAVHILTFSEARSLTDDNYAGKKYYLGFGDDLSGFMGNEVKYDIYHTNDIFTKNIGGDYLGQKIISASGGHAKIVQAWNAINQKMTNQDMYVQYSSGHGSRNELMVGVSYNEIRDNALAMPAKEVVVFIMACYSGNLVSAFNAKKSVWQNWPDQGRSLMVLASSKPNQSSSTGPQTDPDEANGPKGSAGSAFGHSLWKALIGYADGYLDGVKDGFISLGEIRDYSTAKTIQLGGHTPVSTGVYADSTIMNRVPPKALLDRLQNGTEGMTDDQVMQSIKELDEELQVR